MSDPRTDTAPQRRPALPAGFRHLTVSSGIRAAAARTPSKTALLCGERRRNYSQLINAMNRVANAVVALGLRPGQNAAIIAPNCVEYIEIVCGVSDTGAAVVTPNPRLTAPELAGICNDAQVRILFIHPECEAGLDRALLGTVTSVIVLGEPYEALLQRAILLSHRLPGYRLEEEISSVLMGYLEPLTAAPAVQPAAATA